MDNEYTVKLDWDAEADVWIATSNDLQGLVLEADNVDKLVEKILQVAPELIRLNGLERKNDIRFVYSRRERVPFV